jgi:hypothetical protein
MQQRQPANGMFKKCAHKLKKEKKQQQTEQSSMKQMT